MSDEDEGFPGLNKKHGFYRVIERNQVSRDEYHKKHELWKEEKKKEQDSETFEGVDQPLKTVFEVLPTQIKSRRGERRHRRNREDKRPDQMMYQPPGSRGARVGGPSGANKHTTLYRLEIEVKPGVVWTKDINKYGREKTLARFAAIDYGLDSGTEEVLREFIEEFEAKLKLKGSKVH